MSVIPIALDEDRIPPFWRRRRIAQLSRFGSALGDERKDTHRNASRAPVGGDVYSTNPFAANLSFHCIQSLSGPFHK